MQGLHKALGALALHGVGRAAWRDAGQEQRLARIDVADPDQRLLVEQGGLDGGAPSGQPFRQRRPVERLVERLGAQIPEQLVAGDGVVALQQHQPEAPGIVEANLPALVGLEYHVIVPIERMIGGACRIVQGHAARHAEMGDQGLAVVEANQQVLRPSIDA